MLGITLNRVVGQGKAKVIVEGFIDFDYEITLLTVRSTTGVTFVNRLAMFSKRGITGSPGSHNL